MPSSHHLDFTSISSQYMQNACRQFSWQWEPTAQNKASTRLPPILWIQARKDFAMPCVHIIWLIQAGCKHARVIPNYEPVARVWHYHPGSPYYLLSYGAGCSFDFLHGPRRQGCEVGVLLTYNLHQYWPKQNQHPLKHESLLCKCASTELFLTWNLLTDSS